jgi:hypothetical protein
MAHMNRIAFAVGVQADAHNSPECCTIAGPFA